MRNSDQDAMLANIDTTAVSGSYQTRIMVYPSTKGALQAHLIHVTDSIRSADI